MYASARPDEVAHDAPASLHYKEEQSEEDVIQKFFSAFNRRDLRAMAECVADDCEHCNLAYPSPFRGKGAVVNFYKDFMKVVPQHAKFEIEDTTGRGSNIGVIWCVLPNRCVRLSHAWQVLRNSRIKILQTLLTTHLQQSQGSHHRAASKSLRSQAAALALHVYTSVGSPA